MVRQGKRSVDKPPLLSDVGRKALRVGPQELDAEFGAKCRTGTMKGFQREMQKPLNLRLETYQGPRPHALQAQSSKT